jgi:hypothetical protein
MAWARADCDTAPNYSTSGINRLLQLPLALERSPEVVVGLGRAGLEAEGLEIARHGRGELTLGLVHDAKEVQHLSIGGIGVQDLTVDLPPPLKVAGLQTLPAGRRCFGDRCHRTSSSGQLRGR